MNNSETELEALRRENKELREKMNTELSFMSQLSHEVRTPVNSIISLAELASDECTEEKALDYFGRIHGSAEHLLGMLSDILDMARSKSGRNEPDLAPCTLESLSYSICSVVTPMMEKKHIDFHFELHDVIADTLMMDRLKMSRIFINLLSNAAKFTPEGGRVSLVLAQLPAYGGRIACRFTVKDTGCGMSEEFLEKIFTPFEREDSADNVPGTGLGLAITKNLVELMDGRIEVRSEKGKGTEFFVETEHDIPGQEGGNASLEGLRILVADDHAINRILASKLLKKAGAEVTSVSNGSECLKAFTESPEGTFDAIIMDVKMPVMDGHETARRIRASGRADSASVKIVAASANTYPEDKKAALAAGMNGLIPKPFSAQLLRDGIAAAMKDKIEA
ncbi:MAG: response regulator [Ruminococcus sp.]|nr:response regulator [Ruminococcus sp.]